MNKVSVLQIPDLPYMSNLSAGAHDNNDDDGWDNLAGTQKTEWVPVAPGGERSENRYINLFNVFH